MKPKRKPVKPKKYKRLGGVVGVAMVLTTGCPAEDQWARLRACESGSHGLYRANTGNGYYGAYQFDARTWRSVGGVGLPHQANPAEQDLRARILWLDRGWRPWPVCGRHLR